MLKVQLFPVEAGKIFTSSKWGACVAEYEDSERRFRDLTSEGDTREQAFRLIKRRARDVGYRGQFSSYVDTWGNF